MATQLRRLAAFAGLLLAAGAQAQATGELAGVAVDAETGRPLVGAIVQLTGPALEAPRTVVSEDGGKFTLEGLPAGTFALSVQYDGYQAFSRAGLAVAGGETLRVGAWLTPEGKDAQEVVVTGSRIRRKDVTSAAPVTVIDRKQIEQSGVVGLGEYLQRLPFQGNSLNAQRNYGNDGEVRIDLRSLESKRTLVLVNGRRWIAGGPGGVEGIVDLSTIPLAAVDRIEILRDGASAIYGSDAIAGVVNVILKKRFEGTQVSAQAGTSSRGDAESWDFNGSTGMANDRGSLLFSLGFQQQRPVMASRRSWSATPLGYDFRTHSPSKTGSFYTGNGDIVLDGGTACAGDPASMTAALQKACQDYAATGAQEFTYDPSSGGWTPFTGAETFNYQPYSYLLTPARRFQLFSAGNWSLSKEVRVFYEASFSDKRSRTNAAPQSVDAIPVSADSVYNPFGTDVTVYRRMMEYGSRAFSQQHQLYRVVGGLEGEVGGWAGPLAGWSWDAAYTFGRGTWTDTTRGVLRAPQLAAATGPSFLDGSGNPTCGTPAAPIAGCVPVDVLHGVGTASQAQLDSLTFVGIAHGENEMQTLSFNTNGDLLKLWANRPAALALGADWRRESGGYWPDPLTVAGETTSANMKPVSGAFTNREVHAELLVPLVSQRPLVEDLELTAAIRNAGYSTFGSNTSYKLGGRWMPVRDVTLRGTWSTAFRAPNIDELFQGTLESWEQGSDPCSNPTDPGVRQQCINEIGHVNGDYGSGQLRTLEGGNSSLRPETARSFTAGVVLEPRWVRHLAVTADYWDIRIEKTIDTLRTSNILAGCYTGDASANAADCSRIHRDASGRISSVDDRYTNIGGTRTSGVDVAARWLLPAHEAGQFRFDLDASYLVRYDRTTIDGTDRAAGTYDLLFILPRWRWNARLGWERGPFGVSTEARYIGAMKECGNSDGGSGGGLCSSYPQYSRQVRSNLVFDLATSYVLKSGLGTTGVLVGVRNVFNSSPPTIYNGADNNTDPAYDYVGRYFWARVTQSF